MILIAVNATLGSERGVRVASLCGWCFGLQRTATSGTPGKLELALCVHMHLPIEYLAVESLNDEVIGIVDFATSDDYSFPGVTGKHYKIMKIGAK